MKGFAQFIEAVNYDNIEVIINKGEVLYHGTGESFDTRNPRPGGFDNVFWTTDDLMVARSYIPAQGSYIMTSLDNVLKDEKLKKALGVTLNIEKLAWEKDRQGYKQFKYWDEKHKEFSAKWKEIEKSNSERDFENLDNFFKQWTQAEENSKKYLQEWKRYDFYLKKFLTNKLKSLGYEVTEYGRIPKLIVSPNDEVLPANHLLMGKVLKVICKRDFKVYNLGYGKEGDLTDVDYNKISSFRKKEEEGYDGVIINDFAQTQKFGNYGHKSIGFFKKAISDLEIKQIRSQTHPKDEEW